MVLDETKQKPLHYIGTNKRITYRKPLSVNPFQISHDFRKVVSHHLTAFVVTQLWFCAGTISFAGTLCLARKRHRRELLPAPGMTTAWNPSRTIPKFNTKLHAPLIMWNSKITTDEVVFWNALAIGVSLLKERFFLDNMNQCFQYLLNIAFGWNERVDVKKQKGHFIHIPK